MLKLKIEKGKVVEFSNDGADLLKFCSNITVDCRVGQLPRITAEYVAIEAEIEADGAELVTCKAKAIHV